MQALHFNRSYMTFRVDNPTNVARIQLDARCTWYDRNAGTTVDYFLITPCKSERMYLEEGLFQDPNSEFCGVWSADEHLIIRTHASHERDNREVGRNSPRFAAVDFHPVPYRETIELSGDAEIVQATLAHRSLHAVTEIENERSQCRASIEYPIRTMNVDPQAQRFQVDTGPIPWPDFEAVVDRTVDRFRRAFIVYNDFRRAEVVVEGPTLIEGQGSADCYTSHYSQIEVCPARHRLYAVQ